MTHQQQWLLSITSIIIVIIIDARSLAIFHRKEARAEPQSRRNRRVTVPTGFPLEFTQLPMISFHAFMQDLHHEVDIPGAGRFKSQWSVRTKVEYTLRCFSWTVCFFFFFFYCVCNQYLARQEPRRSSRENYFNSASRESISFARSIGHHAPR